MSDVPILVVVFAAVAVLLGIVLIVRRIEVHADEIYVTQDSAKHFRRVLTTGTRFLFPLKSANRWELSSTTSVLRSTNSGIHTACGRAPGKFVFWRANIPITTNGAGASKIRVSLPSTPGNIARRPISCDERVTGTSSRCS
jgi:hypothetical protein